MQVCDACQPPHALLRESAPRSGSNSMSIAAKACCCCADDSCAHLEQVESCGRLQLSRRADVVVQAAAMRLIVSTSYFGV
eukprot:262621-Chlamydomonas_euryale.AAC.8